jgi:hypothetical protein
MQKVAAGVPLLLRRRRGLKLRGRRARGGLDSRTSSRGGPKGGDGDADPPTRQLEMGTAARRRSRPATSSFPAGSGRRAPLLSPFRPPPSPPPVGAGDNDRCGLREGCA